MFCFYTDTNINNLITQVFAQMFLPRWCVIMGPSVWNMKRWVYGCLSFISLMASGLKKKVSWIHSFIPQNKNHSCMFYWILSRFQLYSPPSLSLTKFPIPPGSRDLPLSRLGPTLGNRGGARLLPQLPSSRPPVCCLGLRALHEDDPKRVNCLQSLLEATAPSGN